MNLRALDYAVGGLALAAFGMLLAENTSFGDAYSPFFTCANLAVILLFFADVAVRFVTSGDRRLHFRRHWFDLIVLVPLVQFVPGIQALPFFVIVRQVVIVTMLVSRSRRAGKLMTLINLHPAQMMVASFLFTIGIGTTLLMLPAATAARERPLFVDALFTATSAVCVTGLIVRDTAAFFSRFGQWVILFLIQIGGLGIMTFSAALVVFMRRQMDVKQRAAIHDILEFGSLSNVRRVLVFIVAMTLGFELFGGIALSIAWWGRFPPGEAIYHGAFHAVSAFCNAGFSTFSDSLMRFRADLGTNVVICLLIVFGGLGFTVFLDVARYVGARRSVRAHRWRVQTRVVLVVSAILVAAGSLLIYAMERKELFGGMGEGEAWLSSLFQSVTTRTAGFNTCHIGALAPSTLLLMIVLMFVGASPGSTGGGVKTTTAAVLWASVFSGLRHKEHTDMHRRTIPTEIIHKAMSLLCIALVIVVAFALILLRLENKPFLDVFFETVSAFGTVGLSTGITPDLTVPGRLVITVLMFIGRLGPLTVAFAFARKGLPPHYRYAEEKIMIG